MTLEELKEYWIKKYPNVSITLWESPSAEEYFGQMRALESQVNLRANTIGELISQGETFLRTIRSK